MYEGQPLRISRSPHRPIHWYVDHAYYWITGATLYHIPHLRSDSRKEAWVDEFYAAAGRWQVEIIAWTLMEHHYHAILRPEVGTAISRFCGRIHGRSAAMCNEEDATPGRQVWRQYWDTLIDSEGTFWSRINYIWWNPVRHGFCNAPEDWPWTSPSGWPSKG